MNEQDFYRCLTNIRMSPIVTISEEVKAKGIEFKKETGKDMIPFQRGEIDFPTPDYINNALIKAVKDGFTKYPKSGGEKVLKQAILKKLKDYNNVDGLDEENIVVTYGGQEALELTFKLFQGKKVAGFSPTWSVVLENFAPYAEIDFTPVPLNKDFSVDFEILDKVLAGVDLFYLNTPQNPSGKLFTKEEVSQMVELCTKHNVFLLSDEAYERIVFDNKSHFSPTSLENENIISTFTLSKTYSMTGWRIGYLVTRNKTITRLLKLGNYTQTAGVTTFLQYAGAEALGNLEEDKKAVGFMVGEFEKRRDALFAGMTQIEGLELTKPDGAFYLFPSFTNFIPASVTGEERKTYIYKKLLDAGVAAVYGSCFGSHFTDNLRFSFSGVSITQIEDGVNRMMDLFK